jgi:excisionase family DNA binding protein
LKTQALCGLDSLYIRFHAQAIANTLDTASDDMDATNSSPGFEPLLNDTEAAKFLGGLHPKTLQRWARLGQIPAYRIGRYWRFKATELSNWLVLHSSGQINPPAQTQKEMGQ